MSSGGGYETDEKKLEAELKVIDTKIAQRKEEQMCHAFGQAFSPFYSFATLSRQKRAAVADFTLNGTKQRKRASSQPAQQRTRYRSRTMSPSHGHKNCAACHKQSTAPTSPTSHLGHTHNSTTHGQKQTTRGTSPSPRFPSPPPTLAALVLPEADTHPRSPTNRSEGETARPHHRPKHLQWLVKLIDDILTAKWKELRHGNKGAPLTLPEDSLQSSCGLLSWTKTYFVKQFGLPHMVSQTMQDMIGGCTLFATISTQVELFRSMLFCSDFTLLDLQCFLFSRHLLLQAYTRDVRDNAANTVTFMQPITVDAMAFTYTRKLVSSKLVQTVAHTVHHTYPFPTTIFQQVLSNSSSATPTEQMYNQKGFHDMYSTLAALLCAFKCGKMAPPHTLPQRAISPKPQERHIAQHQRVSIGNTSSSSSRGQQQQTSARSTDGFLPPPQASQVSANPLILELQQSLTQPNPNNTTVNSPGIHPQQQMLRAARAAPTTSCNIQSNNEGCSSSGGDGGGTNLVNELNIKGSQVTLEQLQQAAYLVIQQQQLTSTQHTQAIVSPAPPPPPSIVRVSSPTQPQADPTTDDMDLQSALSIMAKLLIQQHSGEVSDSSTLEEQCDVQPKVSEVGAHQQQGAVAVDSQQPPPPSAQQEQVKQPVEHKEKEEKDGAAFLGDSCSGGVFAPQSHTESPATWTEHEATGGYSPTTSLAQFVQAMDEISPCPVEVKEVLKVLTSIDISETTMKLESIKSV